MSADFANMERYILQPLKSVHIAVHTGKKHDQETRLTLNEREILSVDAATHLGIIRTNTLNGTVKANVEENISKARRTAYSLFGSGLRGHEGLTVTVTIHMYTTYVMQILLYGLELLQPAKQQMERIEIFQKKFLRQILHLPDTAPNHIVYLISGLLPVEAQIHIKILNFLQTLLTQGDNSIEKQIIERQYHMKSVDSKSWIVEAQKVLWAYDLPPLQDLLDAPPTKMEWKKMVNTAVGNQWAEKINTSLTLYKSLKYVCTDSYKPGRVHPLFSFDCTARENNRIVTKLKLMAGTYVLQSTRKNFNQYQVDATCLLCENGDENVDHFLLHCPMLDTVRGPLLADLVAEFETCTSTSLQQDEALLTQCIINCWPIAKDRVKSPEELKEFEKQSNRLLFNLDASRFRMLGYTTKSRAKSSRLEQSNSTPALPPSHSARI